MSEYRLEQENGPDQTGSCERGAPDAAADAHAPDNGAETALPRVTGVERFIAGLIYFFLYNIAEVVIFALGLLQAVIALVFGGPNPWLGRIGASIALWMRDMVRFITGATNQPTFPFARWPRRDEDG